MATKPILPSHTARRQYNRKHIEPLATRAEVLVSDVVEDALATVRRASGDEAKRVAAQAFAAEVAEGRASYGSLLARVWKEAKRTIDEIEQNDDMPVAKRVAALRDLAKLMPMLAKAEANHTARIGNKRIEDMSDRQLEREYRHLRRQRKPK